MSGRYRSEGRCTLCGKRRWEIIASWREPDLFGKVKYMEGRKCVYCGTVWESKAKVSQ